MAALIDADIIAYIASAVGQRSIDWDDGEAPMIDADLPKAKRAATETVMAWLALTGEDEPLLCWTDRSGPTFRYRVHPHYKGQRTTAAKPTMLATIEEYLKTQFPSVEMPDLEGDDVIGLIATDPEKPRDVIMVSTDKDMKTVPGLLMVPGKEKKPRRVRPDRADYYWMLQTIMGDKTDNFAGAPGAGIKAAEAALADADGLEDMWSAVLDVYYRQFDHKRWGEKFVTGDPEDEALMNARCARILRHGDYNYETGEIKLWTP